MALFEIENLSFTYPESKFPALTGINLKIEEGDFVVICGPTGCGKTTLLRLLKRENAPYGTIDGEILYENEKLENLSAKRSASEISIVSQHSEAQIVTDKVKTELAFSLENLGFESGIIRRRVAEMASYFGIEDWIERKTDELSGGQKQLLNLASAMATNPKVLLLDEPTSQLDPIAASNFIGTVKKLNRELGLTVIVVEHRLEELFPEADKVAVLEKGKLLCYSNPQMTSETLKGNEKLLLSLPSAVRVHSALDGAGVCPLTVKEGRRFIEKSFKDEIKELPPLSGSEKELEKRQKVAELKDLWFRYGKEEPDVLRGTTLTVYEGESLCILGANASGKTTALKVLAGLKRPYAGKLKLFGKSIKDYKGAELYRGGVALLPQDVLTVFVKSSVKEDLAETGSPLPELPFDIEPYLDSHPYDLSGGERQLCALAKILMQSPRLLLLDEPTKGLDAYAKRRIIEIIDALKKKGLAVVTVTHDAEFAALCSDRVALFFGGKIVSEAKPKEFFADNSFYTTAASRMTRGKYDGAVTVETAVELCRLNGRRD